MKFAAASLILGLLAQSALAGPTVVRLGAEPVDESVREKLGETVEQAQKMHAFLAEVNAEAGEEAVPVDENAEKIADEDLKLTKEAGQLEAQLAHSIITANKKAGIAKELFQGDLLLTAEQIDAIEQIKKGKRQAISSLLRKRTGDTLYYTGVEYMPRLQQRLIRNAIQYWQNYTCVKFVESSRAIPRVEFRFDENEGCYTYLGEAQEVQPIYLDNQCGAEFISAAHEIGHALGFHHEMSRHDRDEYVSYLENRVDYDARSQFVKQSPQTNENYGLMYDYGSLMHYQASAGGNGMGPALAAKDKAYQMTMGSGIVAFRDVLVMNKLYKCERYCSRGAASCKNGGFPNPNRCGECVCPSGFSGATCEQLPRECGQSHTASSRPQTLSGSLRSGKDEDFPRQCTHMVQAPAGQYVEATITRMDGPVCWEGCAESGIEFKFLADKTYTGARMCCARETEVFTSESNTLPIIAYARAGGAVAYEISYRAVSRAGSSAYGRKAGRGSGSGSGFGGYGW